MKKRGEVYNPKIEPITMEMRARFPLMLSTCTSGIRCTERPVAVLSCERSAGVGARQAIKENRRAACEKHGKAFAKNNGLEWPTMELVAAK